MPDRIYIPYSYACKHLDLVSAKLAGAGFDLSGQCLWDSVGKFVESLAPGDRVVVHSLEVFCGSVELLGALRLILAKGATVYTLSEADLGPKLSVELVEELLAISVEGLLGRSAQELMRIEPSRLGALARVERLIRQEGLSISEACRRVGCSRNAYYYSQRDKANVLEPKEEPLLQQRPRAVCKTDVVWPELSL